MIQTELQAATSLVGAVGVFLFIVIYSRTGWIKVPVGRVMMLFMASIGYFMFYTVFHYYVLGANSPIPFWMQTTQTIFRILIGVAVYQNLWQLVKARLNGRKNR